MKSHALVTGASSGIGEALCQTLARAGYAVTACARREDLLKSLVGKIQAEGHSAQYFVLDVGNRADIQKVYEQAQASFGPLELVIANAGVGFNAPAYRLKLESIEQMIDVNLKGAILAIAVALPGMVERKRGHVVGVSSLAGYRAVPTSAVYSATKAGLSSYLEGIRPELQPHGVYVLDACPGFIQTPMTAKNKFPMPFMISAEEASRRLLGAIRAHRKQFGFPLPMHLIMRFFQMLPRFLYDLLGRAITSKIAPPRPKDNAP